MTTNSIIEGALALPDPLLKFRATGGGIESWLDATTPPEVLKRIANMQQQPLTFEHLNQLLILSHEAAPSRGFFDYYWCSIPVDTHPYDITSIDHFSDDYANADRITSSEQLAWGLERLYIDALLCFGNIAKGIGD